ncbi:hypothetical protein SAMN05216241_10161 [Limimonas halophila]|uniref:Uncharacterized protein n=1 Tax=Limimonas halophila TaxID=1082479 RepID=A0A1G7KZW3_9PROT|nr:hypothetical protein [Limimonas halophila]SDF42681.1 hypothetical protein SAMN05216241_10161 [Limimonas halophila]
MRGLAQLIAAAAISAAFAGPAKAGGIGLVLDTLEDDRRGCRLVFALSNRTGHGFKAYGLTLTVLDDGGGVLRRLPARTRGMPAGVLTATSFVAHDVPCDTIAAVRLDGIFACRTADGAEPDCIALTAPSSHARVPFSR